MVSGYIRIYLFQKNTELQRDVQKQRIPLAGARAPRGHHVAGIFGRVRPRGGTEFARPERQPMLHSKRHVARPRVELLTRRKRT